MIAAGKRADARGRSEPAAPAPELGAAAAAPFAPPPSRGYG